MALAEHKTSYSGQFLRIRGLAVDTKGIFLVLLCNTWSYTLLLCYPALSIRNQYSKQCHVDMNTPKWRQLKDSGSKVSRMSPTCSPFSSKAGHRNWDSCCPTRTSYTTDKCHSDSLLSLLKARDWHPNSTRRKASHGSREESKQMGLSVSFLDSYC